MVINLLWDPTVLPTDCRQSNWCQYHRLAVETTADHVIL